MATGDGRASLSLLGSYSPPQLRAVARDRGTTVSGLVQQWIDERCDVAPAVGDGRVRLNVRQKMDGLAMLGCLGDECAACAFFDPEYRGL